MTQADAEDRQLSGEIPDCRNTDSRVLRPARTRGKDQRFRLHRFDLLQCTVIVSDHFDLRLHRTDQLIQIVRKTVIVIDQ